MIITQFFICYVIIVQLLINYVILAQISCVVIAQFLMYCVIITQFFIIAFPTRHQRIDGFEIIKSRVQSAILRKFDLADYDVYWISSFMVISIVLVGWFRFFMTS